MTTQLIRLVVGDAPEAWVAAGFAVEGNRVQMGRVSIELVGASEAGRGITAWGFDREVADVVEGVLTLESEERPTQTEPHPNGVTRWDHVVMMSPNMDRTRAALAGTGFEARRTREYEMKGTAMEQTFFWMGDVILELVGPAEPAGDGPASLWGLAFVSDDLEETVRWLGERCSESRVAVQKGRRIASLRHKDLDITVPIAFMTPHVNT